MYMEISLKNSGTSACDIVLVAVGNEIRKSREKKPSRRNLCHRITVDYF